MTDDMQWVVLTRSRPMGPAAAILDWSVFPVLFVEAPMLVSILFGACGVSLSVILI